MTSIVPVHDPVGCKISSQTPAQTLNTLPMNTTPEMRHLGLLLYEACPCFCPTTFHKASKYAHDISGLDFEMQDDANMSGPTRYVCDQGERKIFLFPPGMV